MAPLRRPRPPGQARLIRRLNPPFPPPFFKCQSPSEAQIGEGLGIVVIKDHLSHIIQVHSNPITTR